MSKTTQMGSPGVPGDPKEARIASLEGELRLKKGEVDELLRKLDEAGAQVRGLAADKAEADAKAIGLEKNAAELGRSVEVGRTENTRLTAEVARLQAEANDARTEKSMAVEAASKAEAERATLAARLEQLAKDKSAADAELRAAITGKAESDQEWKAAVTAREEAEQAKSEVENVLARVQAEAEQVEAGLRSRIENKDREIKDLHDRLLKAISKI